MDFCERCYLRGCDHPDRQDQISDYFYRRHVEAKQELAELIRVFKDACWYNFEVHCRDWRNPWPQSILESRLRLQGYRVDSVWVNGRKRERGTFPVYYDGTVGSAPPLPPQILIEEINIATDLVNMLEEAISAPYDWAPGGSKYQKLRSETLLPTSSKPLETRHDRDAGRARTWRGKRK